MTASTKLDDIFIMKQSHQDFSHLTTRMAKLKFDDIINDIDKRHIFEMVTAYVYTIEFQKCGLPNILLLLFMSPQDRTHNPVEIDDHISAEITNFNDDY